MTAVSVVAWIWEESKTCLFSVSESGGPESVLGFFSRFLDYEWINELFFYTYFDIYSFVDCIVYRGCNLRR